MPLKGVVLWMSIGIFLVGGALLKGQLSEATDYSGSASSANNTSILIEEEMEEDEINATSPTDIKIEQLANTSRLK
jgi:hypothetical protein